MESLFLMLRLNPNPVRYIDLQRGLPNLTSSLTPEPASSFWVELLKGFILGVMLAVFVMLLFAYGA